ncbi:MAG TPA: lipopolysaccharide kinase InaA family protein [Gemmataceae bacterium]|nr:lipopolysaccharide kinase InaA family protein [Gemmataceae bacterium]
MSYLTIHPDYRTVLADAGMQTAEDFLRLDSVIFCGHPGRNVGRASISTPSGMLLLLIKREHRVPFVERLTNLAGGFGLASKSKREAVTLSSLAAAGISVPEWIAHGEDDAGSAFLILRECTGAVDMRLHLAQLRSSRDRSIWAAQLGRDLATIHQAGFDHPDLYSKHILVRQDGTRCFIDWQRTSRRRHVGWRARIRGLARLHATVASELATPRERLRCLAAYLAVCRQSDQRVPTFRTLRNAIHIESRRISRQRRLRERVRVQTADREPSLVWRDGEALCMTREFEACLGSDRPAWLALENLPKKPGRLKIEELVQVPTLGSAELTRRRQQSWSLLLSKLTGRLRPSSPELRHAGFLFRLERLGLPVARVLAFGQRSGGQGKLESFILRSRSENSQSPRQWLESCRQDRGELAAKRKLLRQAGGLLRQLHRGNFYFAEAGRDPIESIFAVIQEASGIAQVRIDRADALISRRHESVQQALKDLRKLWKTPSGRLLTRTDHLRVLLAYRDTNEFGGDARTLWRRLSSKKPVQALAARVWGLLT